MKAFFLSGFLLGVMLLKAQDTLQIMQYNLLNYNNVTSYCTTVNNPVNDKDAALRTIIDYVLPDIFTVVEMNEQVTSMDRLLSNVMNSGGRTNYARAARSNYAGSDIVNMLYYNTDKLVLEDQTNITNAALTRDINIYHLYYNDPALISGADTSWIHCIVMHLKAGSYPSDIDDRTAEVNVLMNYLNGINDAGNYLVMGDFNVYTSDEECYQNLISHPNSNIRFYDPINMPGDWNNNSVFEAVHTQSTHSDDNGCAASGGLDDRFDFILSSMSILTGTQGVRFVSGSYQALGNDANHFNSSVNSGTNNSAPSSVIDALYNNSDHLPVLMKIAAGIPAGMSESAFVPFDFFIPENSDGQHAVLISHFTSTFIIDAFTVSGKSLGNIKIDAVAGTNMIDMSNVPFSRGLTLFRIVSSDGYTKVYKVIR